MYSADAVCRAQERHCCFRPLCSDANAAQAVCSEEICIFCVLMLQLSHVACLAIEAHLQGCDVFLRLSAIH